MVIVADGGFPNAGPPWAGAGAGQWVDHFTRWCSQCGVSVFSGSCSLHRAEVLSLRGELDAAQQAVGDACSLLPRNSPRMEGEAYRILGDLYLMRGKLDQADIAFRHAHELGFEPQPGYALLQARKGNPDVAIRSLRRALNDQNWAVRQRRGSLLSYLVIIAATHGLLEEAQTAFDELAREKAVWRTPTQKALQARAKGEMAYAQGRYSDAVSSLRNSIACWHEIGSPLNLADARFRLAEALLADNDPTAADLELSAAETIYAKLDLLPIKQQQCNQLRNQLSMR